MEELPQLDDMIVVIPGILGSVLKKGSRDLWNTSNSALWGWLKTWGGSIQDLRLDAQNSSEIVAESLMDGLHYVPGLARSTGYRHIVDTITNSFSEVAITSPGVQGAGNLLLFPYDWRQDNRLSAQQFFHCVSQKLSQWRTETHNPNAKTILLCHSMGGLVARYFLEVLGGWRDCRAFFSFGTPYRGSPSAGDFLSSGYSTALGDLTDIMRTFPSVYQLLPIYPSVLIDGTFHRVAELPLDIIGIDRNMAKDALAFHREIEFAVKQNQQLSDYQKAQIIRQPIVGTHQPTAQSLIIRNEKLLSSNELPGIDVSFSGGDGTVPKASAVPIEMHASRASHVIERHAALPNNDFILNDVIQRVQAIQAPGMADFHGESINVPSGFRVAMECVYDKAAPVVLEVECVNAPGVIPSISIQDASFDTVAKENGTKVSVHNLPHGVYRVVVSGPRNANIPEVHDFFEVVSSS